MKRKEIYNLSASLYGNLKFYQRMRTEDSLINLQNAVKNIFITTEAIEAGFKYEKEVFAGKHGKLSKLVENLEHQIWGNKTIDCGDFYIRIAGKVDAIDRKNNIIYDIKRTSNYNPKYYLDSIQHIYYFYLFPEVTDFYYLVSYKDEEIKVLHIKRPSEEELNNKVIYSIKDFIKGLKEENLFGTFKQYKKYKGR